MYRQGDILIIKVSELPSEVTEIKPENNHVILAHGEATGHKHQIHQDAAKLFIAANDNMYLRVIKPIGDLVHEEHSTINIPIGDYQVIRQREYTDEGEYRIVAD